MPDEHAKLSPSDASRWTVCPAAIRLEAELGIEEEGSVYALEGTLAHELCEIRARKEFGLSNTADTVLRLSLWGKRVKEQGFDKEEMEQHAEQYVGHLKRFKGEAPGSAILIEQRVETGIDRCWGTSDAVIVSPDTIHVVDFKYGQGVQVDPRGNKQLRLYAVGALEEFGDLLGEVEKVTWTVYQPRLGYIASDSCSSDELRAWRDSLKPVGAEALAGSYTFGPSIESCRWCPMSGQCRARAEKVVAPEFDSHPDLLDPEEMAEMLKRVPELRDWADKLEARAFHLAYNDGKPIPGFKVVQGRGRRFVSDPAAGIQTFIDAGFKAEQVAYFKIKGIGALEKLVGKKELEGVLGDLLQKSEGKPSLVPETAPGEPISSVSMAANEFGDD